MMLEGMSAVLGTVLIMLVELAGIALVVVGMYYLCVLAEYGIRAILAERAKDLHNYREKALERQAEAERSERKRIRMLENALLPEERSVAVVEGDRREDASWEVEHKKRMARQNGVKYS